MSETKHDFYIYEFGPAKEPRVGFAHNTYVDKDMGKSVSYTEFDLSEEDFEKMFKRMKVVRNKIKSNKSKEHQ